MSPPGLLTTIVVDPLPTPDWLSVIERLKFKVWLWFETSTELGLTVKEEIVGAVLSPASTDNCPILLELTELPAVSWAVTFQ